MTGRHGARPWQRLAFNLFVAYVAAWVIGLSFGYGLIRTGRWDEGMPWERTVLLTLHAHPLPRWLDAFMVGLPYIGTNVVLLPLVLITSWWLWRRRGQPWVGLHLVAVSLGAFTMNPTMKRLLDRDRPALFEQRGMFNWQSYPSGHLILTPALYFTVALLLSRARGWRWPWYVATAIVVLTSYSRLYLGVHWPTDLIGGALIGVVWLVGCWMSFERHERRIGTRPAKPTAPGRQS